MPTIQVITSTGSKAGNAIFAGTYGLTNPQTGQFEFDSTLRGIYLLDLMSGSNFQHDKDSPLNAPTLKTLEVSEAAVDGLRANLIRSLGERWNEMYSQASAGQVGMAKTAVQAEMSMVAKAVSNAMEKLGFKDVMPALCEARVSFDNVPLREEYGYRLRGNGADMPGHMKLVEMAFANPVEELTPLEDLQTNIAPDGMRFMHGEASLRLSLYASEGAAKEIADLLMNLPAGTNSAVLSSYFVDEPTMSEQPRVAEAAQEIQVAAQADPAPMPPEIAAAAFLTNVSASLYSGDDADDPDAPVPAA